MAESFDNAIKVLEDYHDAHRDSLSNKKPARWSTSPYPDLASMLTELQGTDIGEAYQEHYQTIASSGGGGSGAREQALRLQATLVANMRRAIRAKLVSSVDSRRGRVDQSRYAYIDTLATKVLIGRLKGWVNSKAGPS